MAVQYLFYLDGNLVDEPMGWDKSTRKLIRSDKYKGIFIEYINDLIFQGDGFTYLNSILNNTGYGYGFCTDVVVEIKYRCSDFENFSTYFDGIIKLEDAEIDIDKCQVKCNIEDNSVSQILENKGDVKVSFDSVETIDGDLLSPVPITAKVVNQSSFANNRTGYLVYDSFQYILNYISNNQINFESNLLSDFLTSNFGFSGAIIFTNPGVDLIGAGNIVITYRNGFGETLTATSVKQGTVAATLNYIISQLNFNNTGTTEEKFYKQDYRFISKATHNSTNTVSMFVETPGFSIISITGAAASATSAFLSQGTPNTDNSTRGLGGLVLLNGNQLRNQNITVPLISFQEAFEEINKIADIGMSLTTVYGVTTLRVEHLSYFFDGSNFVKSFTDVPGIKITKAKEFNNNNISVSDGADRKGVVGNQTQKTTWLSQFACASEKIDLASKWISDSSEIMEQLTSADDIKDEDVFIFQTTLAGPYQSINTENRIYSTTTGVFSTYLALNAFINNYWKLIRWFFNIEGDPKCKSYLLDNDVANPIRDFAEFKYPISHSDANDIIMNRDSAIKFNPGTNVSSERVGFIKQIDFDNTTGECTFKLACP